VEETQRNNTRNEEGRRFGAGRTTLLSTKHKKTSISLMGYNLRGEKTRAREKKGHNEEIIRIEQEEKAMNVGT